jgi:hypothetical protein
MTQITLVTTGQGESASQVPIADGLGGFTWGAGGGGSFTPTGDLGGTSGNTVVETVLGGSKPTVVGSKEVYAPVATGTAATDSANLTAAISVTPAGGTLWLDGHYKVNVVPTFPTSITVLGRQKITYSGLSALPSGPNSLSDISATIIEQTVAGNDGIDVTITGGTFHMHDICVAFSTGLASTGHGINMAPTTNVVGVYGGSIDGCMVYGHDGNHYALVLNNELEVTTRNFRWSGGGGMLTICQASLGFNTGNNVHIHPYGVLSASGTAHGYAHSSAANSGASGILNLITYVRPQVNITGAAGTAGTQKLWTDSAGASNPLYINVIGADLEASGYANTLDYGPSTNFIGGTYVASTATINLLNSVNTALGPQALALAGQNAGTQQKTVAIGQGACAAQTTATATVGVGYFALNAATGAQNTALGYEAGGAVVAGAAGVFIGNAAGYKGAGTSGNATVASNYATAIGYQAGPGSTGDPASYVAIGKNATVGSASSGTQVGTYGIAIGAGTAAQYNGSVAIGVNHSGVAATATAQDMIALGGLTHTTVFGAGSGTFSGGVVLNGSGSALATNATSGFTYVPTCAGAPTGTPTLYTGTVPLVFDTTDARLYVYNSGAWTDAFTA